MKTLMILFAAVLMLNTTNAISGTKNLAKQKQNVRNQVNYALATSDISDEGTVTIYFYVFNKNIKVQKVEGLNDALNVKVKERLEKSGVTRKGLNGYYTLTIKLKGQNAFKFSKNDENKLRELMALNYTSLFYEETLE